MVELLDYLDKRVQDFIVSGGGIELMRGFSEQAYGIPPRSGRWFQRRAEMQEEGGRIVMVKIGESAASTTARLSRRISGCISAAVRCWLSAIGR